MSMPENQLPPGLDQNPQNAENAFNSPNAPQSITPEHLQQVMNPQSAIGPLQQAIGAWPERQTLPDYDSTIVSILNNIKNATEVGATDLSLEVQAKVILQLSQAAHYLSQAAQQEGEHIPAAVQVRLQGAQLDLQMQKQAQDMALQHQKQNFDQQLTQQSQQHGQALELAKQNHDLELSRRDQAHKHALQLAQLSQQQQNQEHGQALAEDQQQHDQALAEQAQQAQQEQQAQQQSEGAE